MAEVDESGFNAQEEGEELGEEVVAEVKLDLLDA